jgi:methyl-accepting chemotaxis protein
MTEIVASVQRVTDIIGEITAASAEQSSGIGQVNAAVMQLDQMTQQNAALVEQSAAAAESLKVQARALAGVVATFRLAAAPPAELPTLDVALEPKPAIFNAAPPAAEAKAPAQQAIDKARAATVAVPAAATPAAVAPAQAAPPAKSADDDGDWETF